MLFITQGKTNWKFFLIVIFLAVFVGGGTLWYLNQEIKSSSFIKIPPKKVEQVSNSENTQANPVVNFEECLNKYGVLSLNNYSCQCKYAGETFIEETETQNVEELFRKYTDEEFRFSFYYPKDEEIAISEDKIFIKSGEWTDITIEKKQIEGGYLFDSYMPAGGPNLLWTSYIFYDENQKKYLNYINDYNDGTDLNSWRQVVEKEEENNNQGTKIPPLGHILTESNFYTVSNLSVFNQSVRFGHYNVVCLYPDRFLYIGVNLTEYPTNILDAFTKTIIRTNQKVDEKELEKILTEWFCLLKRPY